MEKGLRLKTTVYKTDKTAKMYYKAQRKISFKKWCAAMFIAALFTIARTWKQPKCPSTEEQIKKLWYIYIYGGILLLFLFSHSVWLFVTPWTVALQASLSFTISWSLLRLTSIKLIMPSNHLILCCPLLLLPSIFPSIRVSFSESVLWISSIGVSVSASVLPVSI